MPSDLERAEQYCADVLAGRIVAGELVKRACERHMRDLRRDDLIFNRRWAQHALDWFQFVQHSKGQWGGHTFRLEGWQCFFIASVFGWQRRDTGHRRFRTVYLEVARKNGKSTISAAIASYLLVGDREPGSEVYCAATTKQQASIVFKECRQMIRRSKRLKRLTIHRNAVLDEKTASVLMPLASDAETLDGLNPHGVICDELHAHPTRELWDVLETATGSRRQSLMVGITTAGANQLGICYELREYGAKILRQEKGDDGQICEDDTFFALIYTLDRGDHWSDEKVWPKANPNLGVSVKLDDLRRKAAKAKQLPRHAVAFRQKHLNEWVSGVTRWLREEQWDSCTIRFDLQELAGETLTLGLDLASTLDLAALVAMCMRDRELWIWPFFWIPIETARKYSRDHDIPYEQWGAAKHIELVHAPTIDQRLIRAKLKELSRIAKIGRVAYDPWHAEQLALELRQDGLQCDPVPQNHKNLNEAAKRLETLLIEKLVKHPGNPVMNWCVRNAEVDTDASGHIRPVHPEHGAKDKVDGLTALVTGLARCLGSGKKRSKYEDEDPLTGDY